MLIEQHADQQCERILGEQCIGLWIADEVQCARHEIDPAMPCDGGCQEQSVQIR